ncbi:hypothetical protein EDC96DRAFT_429182, partial [Choanephora cucurbitarum]
NTIRKKLSRRKAPGVDHLRTEMLLPLVDDLSSLFVLFISLCWFWSRMSRNWCTAQVAPVHKKDDPLHATKYRPISLTSVMRKLLELCVYPELLDSDP